MPVHDLAGFARLAGIFLGFQVADLPGAVHLVAQAPVFHLVGLGIAVADAQVGVIGAGRGVAVFHPGAGFVQRAGAQVDAQHGRRAQLAAVFDEFIGAKLCWVSSDIQASSRRSGR